MAKKRTLSKIQIELNNAIKHSNEALMLAAKDKTAAKRAKTKAKKQEQEAIEDSCYCDKGE